jgi:hypothetical protein
MALLSIICVVGFWCASRTRGTGYNTAEVKQLKRLVVARPAGAFPFCSSLKEGQERCLQILQLLNP